MQSGQRTLESIDQALHQLRDEMRALDREIDRTSTDLVALRQAEADKYRRLAGLRLNQLSQEEISAGLDAADRRVTELLSERERALEVIDEQAQVSRHALAKLENSRELQRQRVAAAVEGLDRAEAATQMRLETQADYRAQLEQARKADGIAARAEQKTEQAQRDRAGKGKRYEADSVFMYLWKRGYGTSQYHANSLIRFLDAKVARLCNYGAARTNYAMLLEIPLRLDQHAKSVRQAADAELSRLTSLEEQAADADGIPELAAMLEQAERELDGIDAQMVAEEKRFRELLEQRGAYAAGSDDYVRRALETLVAALKRDTLASLRREAELTPTAEDDVLIRELIDLEQEREPLTDSVENGKRLRERHLERVQELEEIRHRFKRARYDDVHSSFSDSGLLTMILSEFLRGVATSTDLWGTIRRSQRYRRIESNPVFGSGGIGTRRRSPWRVPSPGGGSRGGGFRTGGGF
jgi:hypothetical protein